MTGNRRLAPPQSRRVNSLAKKSCCNCDNGKCMLLDDGEECVCPQLISYSLLCKWFQTAVLPLDRELHAELLKNEDMRRCTVFCLFCTLAQVFLTFLQISLFCFLKLKQLKVLYIQPANEVLRVDYIVMV